MYEIHSVRSILRFHSQKRDVYFLRELSQRRFKPAAGKNLFRRHSPCGYETETENFLKDEREARGETMYLNSLPKCSKNIASDFCQKTNAIMKTLREKRVGKMR